MLKLGELLFKNRDYTPIPFVIAMIIFANTDINSLILGLVISLFGEIIRILGVAHIGGVSRTKTYSTGRKIVTSGLFAHVRNPLYIGNFFLSVGMVIASNVHLYFTLGFIAFFFFQYIPIVHWEEQNLRKTFGRDFDDYIARVPRWIPTLFPKQKNKEKIKGDFKKAILSEKHTLLAAVALYLILLWRSGWFEKLPFLST
ncbi:isoprenylcysteine carboxylmethyltransferase family protein [bacterium]|nr:isoprenylcysteine carboxylmethyltransferase family protein [bacterium]